MKTLLAAILVARTIFGQRALTAEEKLRIRNAEKKRADVAMRAYQRQASIAEEQRALEKDVATHKDLTAALDNMVNELKKASSAPDACKLDENLDWQCQKEGSKK